MTVISAFDFWRERSTSAKGYGMEEYYQPEKLRQALIVAGMKEIERHGEADFSLRRVAAACGVSCAAPYRHFKNKEELISAICEYVAEQWSLLREQVCAAYGSDECRLCGEICKAAIRFKAANPVLDYAVFAEKSCATVIEKDVFNTVFEYLSSEGGAADAEARALLAVAFVFGYSRVRPFLSLSDDDDIARALKIVLGRMKNDG